MKKRSFYSLFANQCLANIGDTLYIVAVISSIYAITRSAFISSLVPTAITLSMMASGIIFPLVSTSVSLTHILIFSQAAKVTFLCPLAFQLLHLGNVNIALIFSMITAIAFMDGFAQPAASSLIPSYVEKHQLAKANSLMDGAFQILGIGGWAGGSILLTYFSPLVILTLSIVFASLSVLTMLLMKPVPIVHENERSSVFEKLKSGWKVLIGIPLMRTLSVMDIFETFASSAWISSIVLVFVEQILDVSTAWWGYINTTFMIGLLVGSFVCYVLSNYVNQNPQKLIVLGALGGAITTVFVAINKSPYLLLLLSMTVGIFSELKSIPQTTIIQKFLPASTIPEVYSAMNVLYTGTFALSSSLVGLVSQYWGISKVFFISAGLLFGVSFIAYKNRDKLSIN
ncbi:MFS transporter [Lacticaseibacillus paracasei]|uniref:MFS transporter n=1 Tax=Lacticaseibacillus paracasei TaxID=1597 RepID=UPI00403FA89A